VVATEDNTTVEITPTLADAGNTHAANSTFQVTLNKGDVYQYQSANGTDLTGSYIKSVATQAAPCKPIGVFSGSMWTTMGCANASSGDNLYQQQFPLASWGQLYITAPFAFRSYDVFRILVKDPTTVVTVNGIQLNPATLINGRYYEFNTQGNNTARIISSDKPICVLQYMITQNCDGFNSDPEMIVLNSIEQTLTDITVLSARNDLTPPNTNITRHFLNIIIKTAALPSLRIDGALPTAVPVAIPTTAYSYLQEEVTTSTLSNPAHRIIADSGFVAIAYGTGNVESYGYNAGTNVRDLYQFVSVQNLYATVPFPAACKGSPFYFSMVFPYQPTQITWEFFGLFPNVIINNPVYDSTWTINGKQLYRYKLTNPYTINTAGTYPIRVLAQNPTPDGCSGEQQINYQLQVFAPPVADFTFNNVCFPNPVQFQDNSNTGGRPVINRYWDFGDASNSNVNNPSHSYVSTGSYNVKYSLITDVGCLSDTTSHIVTVSPLPVSGASGSTTVCLNAPSPNVQFNLTTGTPPITYTYNINGGPNQIIVSPTGFINIPVPTNVAGTFNYTLVNVQDNSPALCSQSHNVSVVVTVKPLPTANISGNIAVCQNASSPLITFTGSGGTAPYTFTYNINGGPNQVITTTTGNSVTIQVPTNVAGTFTYNLLHVQEGSSNLCEQDQTGSVTIVINPLPTATISGSTEVCTNGTPPVITFTGSNGTAPYTFSYTINNGPVQTVTGSGNTATITVPTTTAGTFVYTLTSVVDASSTACSQSQSGSATVVVHPLPTPSFNFSTPLCEFKTVNFTDASTPNVGTLISWSWDFGDPSSGPANTSVLQNPSHTFSAAGTYTVSLVTTNDKGCSNVVFTRQVIIKPKPLAGFIVPDVCLNDTYAQFQDTSSVGAPDVIAGWQWNFGDPVSGPSNTSTLQNPQHSYTAVGSYTVELIVTTGSGCRDTVQQNLFVNGSFPVANFNVLNPAALCANDSVSIVEASTVFPGNITKVEIYWDNVGQPAVFDTDNNPFTGRVYKHLYPNFQTPLTKVYTIRYRAYSGGVYVNDKVRTITINAAPKVQFNNITDACLDAAPFQVTQASEIGGVPGNGFYSGPGISPTGIFNPASVGPGTYTIKYKFISTTGGCADSLTNTITVLDSASARFSFSSPVCDKSLVSFNSSTSTIPAGAGMITGWTWNFNDPASGAANISSLQSPSHLFTTWGSYNVSLSVTTSNGCRSTSRVIPVYINPLPKPNFSFPASACLPSATIQFTNASTIADNTQAGFSYLWNFGDPASGPLNNSTGSNPSHIYSATGPFNVNLQVTSAAGCVHDTTIIVNTIHAEPVASFNVDKSAVCVGGSIQFTDNTNQMGGTPVQWNWDMGDGNTRTGSSVNYTYAAPGTYTVSLYTINNFGCRSTTFSMPVTINPYPVVDAGPDRLVLEGGQITLQPTVTGSNLSYLWTPNVYFAGSNTVLNPVVLGVDDITYTLTVTGIGGCSKNDQVFIKVLKGPEIPNIFSPNGDGIHDTWVIKYLDSYPGCTVEIFNRYGQRIYRSVGYTEPWDGTIDGKPVPLGTYYYVVDPKNGRKTMSGYVDIVR
jgi:gliding motility-associated-like protein